MVVHVVLGGAQQDEEEPHRDRDLQHRLQQHRLVQPHERHGRLLQEVHATWGHGGARGQRVALPQGLYVTMHHGICLLLMLRHVGRTPGSCGLVPS